ncbi:lipid A biosynthesis acyltransferase [Caulobacter vibrioides]|uniref:lysophospholipid acyltransferase family protein n=1 Tax=Caulobacter vibrioides TaxID=155892 RepID=UPI000BB466BB|nr:lysophospholipid acyltransferase family protein [Caulobacter vibrioides]ATC25254.1 lipid A biosynthesis acyltransferase [Caulobacter vibrioides]AZH13351.1 lipid A biosynthesis acyltransferase [Caulobacter vibrioides]PLR14024.1 lipid A biosynthesis acyltransferase [Caulobacter vibrioides]
MSEKRQPWVQDLLWRLEALGFDLFIGAVRLMGVDRASDFGGWLGRTFGPMSGAHKVASRNLKLAFPDKDAAWHETILREQWDGLGRSFAEFPLMDKILPSTGRVEVVGKERLVEIAENRIPVVFVSGHLSNWEVMPAAIVDSGVICEMTYRAANNPYVDKRIKESRFRYGVRLFAPKGGDGARELLEGMKQGKSVALMNDQKFNSGVAAPFFGHLAHTAPGPTRLAIRFGTVLQPMSVQRLKGARFRAVVHDPIVPPKTGDRTADIEAGVRMINAFMEDRIRERPAEWFWVHRRWPNEVYAALAERERAAESSS